MKTAQKIKDLSGFRGHAALYKLSVPYGSHNFLVVSAADVPFYGPETYMFPATDDGKVIDWGELGGSFRGGLDHVEALAGAGYEVVE